MHLTTKSGSVSQESKLQRSTTNAILVLGMHRSGTSAVTRMLNLCGADLGRHMLPPKQDNERGFWENKIFLDLHEQTLARWNLRWHDVAVFPNDWREGQVARQFASDARKAVTAEFGTSQLVMIKDPRLSLLAPLWTDTLKEIEVKPAFVIVVRHPDEVAASLGKRDGLSQAHSRMLWLQHMIECVRGTRGFPRVFVHYENVLRDWRTEQHRIQKALAIEFPKRNVQIEAEIDEFIEPSLRHHCIRQTAQAASPLPALLDNIYRHLQQLCAANASIDQAYFSSILVQYESQMEVAAPLIRDLTETITFDRDCHLEELDRAREVIRARDEEIEQARTTIESGKIEIEQSRLAHRARDELESSLRTEIKQTSQSNEQLREENRRITQAWRDSETTFHSQLENTGRELAALREELAKTIQSRDGIEAAYAEQLSSARNNIDALANDIERARDAHRARDITERVLLDEISTLRGSAWFRLGRAFRILSAPQAFAQTEATPNLVEPPSMPETLRFAIEAPTDGAVTEGIVHVTGWCFDTSNSVAGIRIHADDRAVQADANKPRPDVAAAFGETSDIVNSGFSTTIALPEGTHTLVVEARTTLDDAWHVLGERSVVVRPATLRVELDTPVEMLVKSGQVRFSGWCAHPHARIMDLSVIAGRKKVACQYHLERADVGKALPDIPGSANSGFEATLDLPPGKWSLGFTAVLEDGSECTLQWPQKLRVKAPALHQRIAHAAHTNVAWVRLALREGQRWVTENRRLPRPREIPQLIRLSREMVKQHTSNLDGAVPSGFRMPQVVDKYEAWQNYNHFTQAARRDLERRLAQAGELPVLSIVMPVYNPPLEYLRQAVDSVQSQVYADWELCIADDASTVAAVSDYLRELAATESRVRLCLRETNGNISAATNSAAELASGEFLVFVDQDDLLTPDALGEIALCAATQSDADIVYSDDDKIDVDGHRFAPQFKPDWSPELLLGYMYFSHVFAVRRDLYERVGGMRIGFEGSQDYDFALRASECARAIAHIPQVLYHWRVLPGSTAASGAAKPASFDAGLRAVGDALRRRGNAGRATQPAWAQQAAVGIFAIEFPDDGPLVSIVIPTYNGLDILRRCIDSLNKTRYRNYEVVVVDNDSDDPATLEYLAALPHRIERISNPQGRFNFAYINNRAAERARGDLLLFLNNDTEVIESNWLSQMVGYAGLAGVGAVGARLLYPDKRIQHAGIVHGYYHGMAGPAFKLTPSWDNGYLSYARVARNYSAVTAACMLTARKLFLELGGFDETRFEVAYNDVDYCYRLGERGLRCVYCADAELLHHEGHSRGFFDRPQEIAEFRRLYARKIDPYYSPHLSLDNERFAIKPRRYRLRTAPAVRVLMCAFNLNWEGAPYSQFELTLGLKRGGHIEPVVYAPQDGPLRSAYENAGIPVHIFDHPLAGVFDENAYDCALDRFGAFIGNLGVDLVYGNTLQTFYAIDAAHRLGLPCLWNPRESEPWQTYFNFLPAPLAARALRCFEYPYRVVFVADATRAVWEPLDSRDNFCVIHNGLDLERLRAETEIYPREQSRRDLGIGNDEIAVLLPGTVCERKGQQDLLHAIAQLPPATAARLRCFIVGDRAGTYSVELHKLADSLPLDLRQRVQIVGETQEIARYYQAADIFVCTSRVESFPRVVLEAMFFGLPVISTRVFGVVEQVSENVNGLLYEPSNIPKLTLHLRQLIDDDRVRARLAANSQPMLATLNTFDEMAAAYAEIFREAALVGTPPPTGLVP
ncbi:MAG TPA: glycosyltransferase [Rudaea sp.]|nr:glycosyltransferase [Rudaea sp.]